LLPRLSADEILKLLETHPEQSRLDYKRTLILNTDQGKGELVKDVAGIANSHGEETGYLLFGVDLAADPPLIGLSNSYDDADLQQIVNSKLEKPVPFVYHEVSIAANRVGVLVVPQSLDRPHIAKATIGPIRAGDIKIRKGSSTTWATWDDLRQMFEPESRARRLVSIREIIARAANPDYPTSSLALEAWQAASSIRESGHIEWIRKEVVGFASRGGTPPKYRMCAGYAVAGEINPYALASQSIETIASREASIKKVKVRVGSSLAELEEMVRGAECREALLYIGRRFQAVGGGRVEANVYFTTDSIRLMIGRIRTRIVQFLMDMEVELRNASPSG